MELSPHFEVVDFKSKISGGCFSLLLRLLGMSVSLLPSLSHSVTTNSGVWVPMLIVHLTHFCKNLKSNLKQKMIDYWSEISFKNTFKRLQIAPQRSQGHLVIFIKQFLKRDQNLGNKWFKFSKKLRESPLTPILPDDNYIFMISPQQVNLGRNHRGTKITMKIVILITVITLAHN